MTLTPEELSALREAEAKMTPAPWTRGTVCDDYGEAPCGPYRPWEASPERIRRVQDDATGIALLRNALPRLLETIEELTRERDEAQQAFDDLLAGKIPTARPSKGKETK